MRTLTDINLAPHDRAAVLQAAATLRRDFPVEQIILFGSKARGDAADDSDIDLLVLTSRPVPWPEQARMIRAVSPIQREHDVLFSLLIVPREEWLAGLYQVLPLRREVDRDGVAA